MYAVICSEPWVKLSTPVVDRKMHSSGKTIHQTKPDDPKFVGRLKTLNLGVSPKRRSSRGRSYFFVYYIYYIIFCPFILVLS